MRHKPRVEARDPATIVTSWLPEVDPALRDGADPDPVVERMVQRLRTHLTGLVALDEFDRPVPWRTVVRLALGPDLDRLSEPEPTAKPVPTVIQLPPARRPTKPLSRPRPP